MSPGRLPDTIDAGGIGWRVFIAFAFAYFLSAVVRGVTATLAPAFTTELGLQSADLGLLAGAYFIGFATTQLPLGGALDRFGPKRVLLGFLVIAVVGCAAFAAADGFAALTVSRMLIGIGVSACLMAPLTHFRLHHGNVTQMRATSWMMMTGSLGMVASTLPVQWLLPVVGWRWLFWALAALFVVAAVAIAAQAPADGRRVTAHAQAAGRYADVFRHPTFLRFAPMAVCQYAAMMAVQSLWAGPWLVRVCGWTPAQAALGLFGINCAMLVTFMVWGALMPRLLAAGWHAESIIARGAPVSIAVLLLAIALGERADAWVWGAFCVSSTVVSLSQPAIGQALPAHLAGRALSAHNLLIFVGVFVLQWGIGGVVDLLRAAGAGEVDAFRGAFALVALGCVAAYLWFLRGGAGVVDRQRAAIHGGR